MDLSYNFKTNRARLQKVVLGQIHLAEKPSCVAKKMRIMRAVFLLVVASCVACQQLPLNYSDRSMAGARAGMCPDTQDLREAIEQDIRSLINSRLSMLSALVTEPGYRACGCGGNLNFHDSY